MSASERPERERLQELCDALLEGRAIDWDLEGSRAPGLRDELKCLRQLDALERAHRYLDARDDSSEGGPMPSARPLFEWGPLQVLERVGSGSFGEVYRAWDARLQRDVALKLRREGPATGDTSARRFLEEARALARIRHPNVLAVYGTDVHENRVGFWTELLRGETLAGLLAREGARSVEEAAVIGVTLCEALAAVHDAGLIHGDVKASNVIREEDGRIVLMDLGSFTGPGAGGAGPGAGAFAVMGTPLVSAPEVLRGDPSGIAADLYSLGVLLYQLVTGRYPVTARNMIELFEKLERGERTSLRDLRPDLPGRFVLAVERALESEPSARFRSAGDMERALRSSVPALLLWPEESGQTLQELRDELGLVPEEMCRTVGREVARALAKAQASGERRVDIEPDNILLLGNGTVRFLSVGDAVDSAISAERPSPIQELGELLSGLVGERSLALSESPTRPISPFFQGVLQWMRGSETAGPPATVHDLLRVLAEGEAGAWWRDRQRRWHRTRRRALRRIQISRETAMYGRSAEMATLREAYERVRAGEGLALLLEGEAGIGKTRLVDELIGLLEREGEDFNFLYGSYPPGGAATATGAFLAAYRDHLGEEGLEEAVQDYLSSAPLLIPAFVALLKGQSQGSEANPLTKDSLQTAFVRLTQSLAAERPTIVLIDDIHFAPADGSGLFVSTALAVPGHRILLLGGTRPGLPAEWTSGLERLEHCSRLALARLSQQDVVRILAEALDSDRLAEELAPGLARRSDGNPLFLFENLRALEEAKVVTRNERGAWITTGSLREIPVPSSIQNLIQARLEALGAEDRELLEVASCVGFEFDPALVAEAAEVELLPALKRFALIERRHHLIRSAGRRYAFDHHQVQEALYAGLFEQLREQYHAALAKALERTAHALERDPQEIEGQVAVALCEHYFRGGRGQEGLRYLSRSLAHLGTLQPAASAEIIDRALGIQGLVAGSDRIDLLAQQARHLFLLGKRDEEQSVLQTILLLADELDQPALRARARRMLGFFHGRSGRPDEARSILEGASALAREGGDVEEEARVTQTIASLALNQGRYEDALSLYAQALERARHAGDHALEGQVLGSMGVASMGLRRLDEGQQRLEEALAIARELGSRSLELIAVGNLGALFLEAECYDEALPFLEEHLSLARQTGIRLGETYATGNLAELSLDQGRSARALDGFERALAIARQCGYRVAEAENLGRIGGVLALLGRRDDGRITFERCLELSRGIHNSRVEGTALIGLGALAESSLDFAGAENRYERAERIWTQIGATADLAGLRLRQGGLLRHLGRLEEAQAALKEAAALGRQFRSSELEVLSLLRLAVLPGGDVAQALGRFAACETRLRYVAKMEARFLLWEATTDRAHLEAAHDLLLGFRDHAPERDRETLMREVPLHRNIEEAWRESLRG